MRNLLIFSFLTLSIFEIKSQILKDSTQNDSVPYHLNMIILSEKRADFVFKNVPGSASRLSQNEIVKIAPISANEIFRKVSGVHVVDEEGAGMRINIGIRGLDPDRSRNVLVLEDGVPVALNPYGEPEMYYSPLIDRMSAIEVLKGSGQIMFGPQTIGGVVNYVTAMPSEKLSFKYRSSFGQGGFKNNLLGISNTYKNLGFSLHYVNKGAEKLGYSNFQIHDLNSKLLFKMSKKTWAVLKLGYYNEKSNATYIGLNKAMFLNQQYFDLMAPSDLLRIKRISSSFILNHNFSSRLKVENILFYYQTDRLWMRQNFTENKNATNKTSVIWGDSSISGGAIYMLNSNAHRNRYFNTAGIESRWSFQYNLLKLKNELKWSLRYISEMANEQRINGSKFDALSGSLVEDEMRNGNALSGFIHQNTQFKKIEKLSLSYGIRFEQYNYGRNIYRNTFKNKLTDTLIQSKNYIFNIIPGIGFNYLINSKNTLFGGLHKGYAPPRVKDAISNQGEVYELNAEESFNYEIGSRGEMINGINYEMALFYMDFKNQIIPVSESSGGTGSGLINGGRTFHKGAEIAFKLHANKWFNWKSKLIFQANLTFLDSRFVGDRFQINENKDTINLNQKRTPYSPNYFHTGSIQYILKNGFGIMLNSTFVGSQFTDALNTKEMSKNGRIGEIKSYSTYDVNVFYNWKEKFSTLSISIKNITDETYVVSRRPQGTRMGLPRWFFVSYELAF